MQSPVVARIRRAIAIDAGKVAALASRLLGKGGGTALPGLVAERVHPEVVRELARQLPGGTVVVAGTNGKTTTARMAGAILQHGGYHPMRNESGSNLMRGLASALVDRADLLGNLPASDGTIGLFEVDEAAFPAAVGALQPGKILLLDLFRDQLDRYGEVATIARLWSGALGSLQPGTQVVANADDPLVTNTADSAMDPVLFFGVESAEESAERLTHASDVKSCPRCGGRIEYTSVYLGHLGHYRCTRCDFCRPVPLVHAENVRLHGVGGASFDLLTGPERTSVVIQLPGMYNVYNALAAAALASSLGVSPARIAEALGSVSAAFGRMERLEVRERSVYIALAKNPTGLNEIVRTLTGEPRDLNLLVMLSDNAADGRDVSWIWDADVEVLAGRVRSAVFGGTRAEDMALRFKYAGALPDDSPLYIEHDSARALDVALDATPPGGMLFIVPTYTAMLDVRGVLSSRGVLAHFWEG